MSTKTIVLLIALSLVAASCSTFAPAPTATPTQTARSTPTETPSPTATSTPLPTSTPKPPTATPDVISAILPVGTPISEWKGIPIMPDAINGEGDDKGYTFTIKADSETIQVFYETELSKQGYTLFATGTGSGKNTVMLIFMKGTDIVSISIIPSGELMLVLIVK